MIIFQKLLQYSKNVFCAQNSYALNTCVETFKFDKAMEYESIIY